jgi:hypothetical protein
MNRSVGLEINATGKQVFCSNPLSQKHCNMLFSLRTHVGRHCRHKIDERKDAKNSLNINNYCGVILVNSQNQLVSCRQSQ